ncbi:MAG: Hcp family type VI secretion system effector [Gammaproteobacteria bacterium]
MAIYLKFGNVKGNVTADGYAGQIAVKSIHVKVSRQVSMEAGNLSNRESTKPNLSVIEIVKNADSSVATLFKEALTGAAGQEAVITFVRTGAKVQEYMTYKLSDCIVSHYDIDAGDEDDLVEKIQLSYSAIEVSYKDHDATNKAGSPLRVRYDVKAAKAS